MHLPRRALAASALALTALTTATGCTATNAQQTAEQYAPGAVASTTLGTVHVGGLFVAAGGEGPAALVASIVNSGTAAATVEIADTGSSGLSGSFDVDPGSTLDVGTDGEEGPQVTDLEAAPGAVLEMTVSTGGQSRTLAVPVLDGTLEQYAAYVPTPSPTTAPTPTTATSSGPTSTAPSSSGSPSVRVTGSPSATGSRTGSAGATSDG